MIMALKNDFLGRILYGIGSALNGAIYSMVSLISEGLLNISNTQMFSGGVEVFTRRIYVILGIYMLFKLAFSLLNSVINPDALLDKEKGMQKIVPRTIMMLILLIMVPTIYDEALNLQAKIVPVIPKIIIGKTVDTSNNSGANYGENMASMALGAFIIKNDECKNGSDQNQTTALGSSTLSGYTVSSMLEEAKKACDKDSKIFEYDFNWFMSAIVGIVLVVILFFYSLDVAIRLIKLGLLQLLAPIPIISYIDPKSSKDGAFASWLKMSISTYLDLFIKLGMFYFVIFVLSGFASGDVDLITLPSGLGPIAKAYVTLMVLVGAVFFLMQGPKFIYGMLGIKSPNQGIGLSGALAGTAALLGGAGLMGSFAASTKAMSESSQAEGQGKQAPNGWSSGSDLAAQLRTGDQKAKGGFVNNYVRGATRTAQQSTAARTLASRFGITQQGLDEAKQQMLLDQDKADAMKLAYQSGHSTYSYQDWKRDAAGNRVKNSVTGAYEMETKTGNFALTTVTDPNDPTKTKQVIDSASALNDISQANTTAAKSKSNYEKGSKIAEQYGLDQTSQEKYRRSVADEAAYHANRVMHPVQSRRETAPDRQTVRDRAIGRNGWDPGVR